MTGSTSIQPATTTMRPLREASPHQDLASLGPAPAPPKSPVSIRIHLLLLAFFVVIPVFLGIIILTSDSFATKAPPIPESTATKPNKYPTDQFKSTTPEWSALFEIREVCEAYKRSDDFDKEPKNYELENIRLFKESVKQEAFKKELELASKMQYMLIPSRKILPRTKTLFVDSFYHPHFEVGGDYYDFIQLNEKEFGFCIADVSGKGIPAALLMSNFQACLRTMVSQTDDLKNSRALKHARNPQKLYNICNYRLRP